jgi:signal-transduction protein with cAMP-binding, CBS, and nucleotidyltransferase domain
VPRFLKQMADNALRLRAPLNWRGALETQNVDGRAMLDLKLHGTALFVDAARLYALAHGLPVLGTRARLEAAGPLMHVAAHESEAWVTGFEFLQMLRLQVQIGGAVHARQPQPASTLPRSTTSTCACSRRPYALPAGCSSAWGWTISADSPTCDRPVRLA